MFETARMYAGAVAVLIMAAASAQPAGAAPQVVVSIAPVHSLVAAVMLDVGAPHLLVPASASPHLYSLRPSDAQALAAADIVFRVGPDMETFLDKPLASLVSGTVITLAGAPGITKQPITVDGAEDHTNDPHIWLSIANARRIAEIAAETLTASDPGNTKTYRRNLANLNDSLDQLERKLRKRLEPVRQIPYVVMHDAYRHFETEFGLRHAAAISLTPERRPGARQLYRIRNHRHGEIVARMSRDGAFTERALRTALGG